MGNLSWWLTPVWLLSIGVTIGAAVLLVLYGLLWLVSRPAAAGAFRGVRDGVLQYVSYVIIGFVILCGLVPAAQVASFGPVVESLRRLPYVRSLETTIEVPAQTVDQEVPLQFHADELQRYSIESGQDLIIGVEPGKAISAPLILVEGNVPYQWAPGGVRERKLNGPIDRIFVTNSSDAPTTVTMSFTRDVPMPEVRHIPIIAAAVVCLYLIYLALQWLMPRASAVALATTKECIAQPLYLLFLVGGAVALLLFIYMPYNTFGEDVKILKDSGLTTIMVLAILIGVWSASVSVADEIEGRTALTVLSKPISRRQFVLGKFMGITWPVLLLFILLGTLLLITVSYKVVYDARETTNPDPTWQACYAEMIGTVAGLALAFMEAVVLTAISVAVSTRLSMLPNLIICGAVYVLGHLIPPIVQSSAGQNEFVAFVGRVAAIVIPVLDHFNIQAAVASGVNVPWEYLGWALVYCVLYSATMMLLALVLFEDRDLA
jgi:ABC-type transport system involved in multi-copper enzyme maturation permease subunit